jgi:hypothetical protein
MSKTLKSSWIACAALACFAIFTGSQTVVAQSDCGCNQAGPTQGYSLDNYGASPCDNGCGTGTFMGRLRNAFSCDSKFRPGLWDGYCDERVACDRSLPRFGFGCGTGSGCGEAVATSDCGTAAADGCGTGCGAGRCNFFGSHHFSGCSLRRNCGLGRGLRMFQFPQAAGCGSGAYGLPSDCGCGVDEVTVAAPRCDSGCNTGGCNSGGCSIFGLKHNCFRNDGHFFGCLSRHGHRHGLFSGHEGCGCGLFSGLRGKLAGFGSCGSGHCQNGCEMNSYEVGCGSDIAQPQPVEAPTVPAQPAETQPAQTAPAEVSAN